MSDAVEPPVVTRVHPGDEGDIFEIMINRPAVHNCVDGAAAALLLEAWQRFARDDRLLVAVLHGAGDKAFCSGADLKALDQLAAAAETPASRLLKKGGRHLAEPGLIGEHAIRSEPVPVFQQAPNSGELLKRGTGPMGGSRIIQLKPVITMSQGYTYAGGLELFCHGHIRIAEPQATFSVACRRWGVPLVDGGTVYLPRLLGWAGALPLIITGERIGAQRAHQIGLIWELVPQGAGLARALDVARQICQQPRDAMLADLSSAILGMHRPLEDALESEAANMVPVMQSESTARGLARFLRGERFWFK